jgi:hypothetical protein
VLVELTASTTEAQQAVDAAPVIFGQAAGRYAVTGPLREAGGSGDQARDQANVSGVAACLR